MRPCTFLCARIISYQNQFLFCCYNSNVNVNGYKILMGPLKSFFRIFADRPFEGIATFHRSSPNPPKHNWFTHKPQREPKCSLTIFINYISLLNFSLNQMSIPYVSCLYILCQLNCGNLFSLLIISFAYAFSLIFLTCRIQK